MADEAAGPPDRQAQVNYLGRTVHKGHQCKTCLRPDVDLINDKRRKGDSISALAREYGIPETSLTRHFRHSGVVSIYDGNTDQAPFSENWRCSTTDAPPEGMDPLLRELAGLRVTAQRALGTAQKTRNLTATASLLRSANGLLETVAKIEKDKAEEQRVREASRSLEDRQAVEDRLNRRLDDLAARLAQSQAVQQPQTEAPTPAPDGKPTKPGVH